MLFVQVWSFGNGTRYGFEKMIKTKSQKGLGVNSYICRSFRGKLMVPVQNREQMKSYIIFLCKIKGNGGSDKKITASIITHLLPVEIKQKNMDLFPFISTFNNLKNITNIFSI